MQNKQAEYIYLNGYIDVPEEKLEIVKQALVTHIALTHAEPGCIAFNVTADTKVKGRFLVAEIFETQTAFDNHQLRTKASKWFEITKDIPREYSINVGSAPNIKN